MPAETLPKLPLVCLKTADFKNTDQVVEGKNTIIGKLSSFVLQKTTFDVYAFSCHSADNQLLF